MGKVKLLPSPATDVFRKKMIDSDFLLLNKLSLLTANH